MRAGRGGYCDRRPGRYLQPYRELHGLPDGHFRCGPGLARRGTGNEVRNALRDAATGDRSSRSSRIRASAPPSTTDSASVPEPWWSRPACNIAGRRSSAWPTLKAPAFIMPRPKWRHAIARERKRSSLAAAIRRGKQRCSSAARRVACAYWFAGRRLQRRCRATSPAGSPQIPESQLSMAPR